MGWGDIATNADLRALEYRLDTRIDGVVVTLRGEMAELRGDMRGLPGIVTKTFVTWLLASQATVIAVVGFLLR